MSEDEVLVGVGSDEVISLLLTVLCQPRGRTTVPTLLTTTPTFVMYKLSAKVRGQRVLEVPLDADWDISVPAMTRALSMAPPNLVFVASPNNPTGTQPDPARLDEIIEAAAGALVVIDEAYADYAARRHIDLYRKHENVALLRTLSKVGFAALRLGWLIGRPELVAELDKARLPYNVATPTQELATVVLEELSGELARVTSHVMAERERVSHDGLGDLGRRHDGDAVRHDGQVAEGCVGGEPFDLAPRRVDGVHLAAGLEVGAERLVAVFRPVARGTDDGERAAGQERVDGLLHWTRTPGARDSTRTISPRGLSPSSSRV